MKQFEVGMIVKCGKHNYQILEKDVDTCTLEYVKYNEETDSYERTEPEMGREFYPNFCIYKNTPYDVIDEIVK